MSALCPCGITFAYHSGTPDTVTLSADLALQNKQNIMRYSIGLAGILALIWLSNSGIFTPLIIGLGILSIIFVVWLSWRLDLLDDESTPFYLTRQLPGYYLWLVKQIILSNIDVVKRVWLGPRSISPCVADVALDELSDMGRVIYANSITLTPGTVVLDLQDQRIRVHAISREGMDDLLAGELGRRVARLER